MTDEPLDDLPHVEAPEDQADEAPAAKPAAPAWSEDDEDEARRFGWKSPDEWKGERPRGYVESPTEYMERVKRSKTFTAMEERLRKSEAEAQETARKMQAVYDQIAERQRQEYETQLAQIAQQQRRAVETKDVQAFDALAERRAQLERQAPVAAPPGPVPAVAEYRQKHEWAQDPALWMEAAQAVDLAARAGHVLRNPEEQLAYAESVMKRKYPHLFQPATPAPAPARPSPVDPGGIAGGSRGPSLAALPAEARAAFSKFVKDGLFTDDAKGRAAYLEMYNAG